MLPGAFQGGVSQTPFALRAWEECPDLLNAWFPSREGEQTMTRFADPTLYRGRPRSRKNGSRPWLQGAERLWAYFCTYTPVELIHAAGFVPVRILGGDTAVERARLSDAQLHMPLLAPGVGEGPAGRLRLPEWSGSGYTCDAACGLINIWELNVPGELYHTVPLPYVDGPEARRFLRAALVSLWRS